MDGQLEQVGARHQLRFMRKLAHAPDKVWRAITEPEQLKVWFPDEVQGEFKVGGILRFGSPHRPDSMFEGEILEFRPPSVLEFRWDANETVRFEVEPDADGTGSVLTLLNTFDELGKAARDAAGWHACLDVLEFELDGATAPWTAKEHWQHLRDGYVERFGPEASSIGPPTEQPYAK